MNKSHKIKLNPTKAQKTLFEKSFGCARHSYNWALTKWQELYKDGQKTSAFTLIKLQNSLKKTEMPFYLEVNKCAVQYAIHNLYSAFKKMWKGENDYPKFKRKGINESYVAVENKNNFKQIDKKIWIPRIGWVKCYENLRFDGKVNNVVIKRIANNYFAIINIEVLNSTLTLKPNEGDNQAIVGVDMGIKSLLVLSDGTIYENPTPLKNNLKRLKRLQRKLTRKQKGSNNRKRMQIEIAKKHYRVTNIRKNSIHKATSEIIKKYDKIVIENLKPKNMVKNKNLSQSIMDVSFGEISSQLAYKALWYGKELVKADQWFASSKICCSCGHKKEELKLSERVYKCDNCGLEIDRDLNAAKNLANYGTTHKSGGSKACGESNSVLETKRRDFMKQEINDLSNKILQKCT